MAFNFGAVGRSRKAAQFGGQTGYPKKGGGRGVVGGWPGRGSKMTSPFDGLPCILRFLFFFLFFFFWDISIYLKRGLYLHKEKSMEPGD